MIQILLLDHFRETVDEYLQTWARSLQEKLRTVAYESLSGRRSITGSVFIFSDLDRLSDAQCGRADAIASALESAGARVFNRPSLVLGRYALLRALHDSGHNPFNVYRLSELNESIRFPVFIRQEHEHEGPLTPLLRNSDELKQAIADLRKYPAIQNDLLIVEFVQTSSDSDGLFRKYSVQRIGEKFIPRHVLFSKNWIDKTPDVVTRESLAEESEFLKNFPHADAVLEIFNLSKIDFGRIDYSLLNGKIVTWEINTNPRLLPAPEEIHPERLAGQATAAAAMREAWLALAKSKPITARLSSLPPVIDSSDLSLPRQLLFTAARFWDFVSRFKIGKRMIEAIVRSIQLKLD